MLLFRNNAVYAFILCMFMIILLTKYKIKCITFALKVLLLFYLCSFAITTACSASKGSIAEMLAVPIQQVARAVNYNSDEISKEEKETIYEIIPPETIKNYNPQIADPVKNNFNQDVFLHNPFKYIRTYINIGLKTIGTYINAFLINNLPYWYPYVHYTVPSSYMTFGVRTDHSDFYDFQIEQEILFPQIRQKIMDFFYLKQFETLPIIGLIFNEGLLCWSFLIGLCYLLYTKNMSIIPLGFVFCIYLTILLAPVAATRYLYPIIVCLPVIYASIFRKVNECPDSIATQINDAQT